MKALAKLPAPVKTVVKVVLFPFVLLWVALGVGLYWLGEKLQDAGDWMTDGRASSRF
jgi:uncharacterized membrane protein